MVKNSFDPEFNEQFLFKSVDTSQIRFIRAHVFSKNLFVSDEFIGTGQVSLLDGDKTIDVDDLEVPILSKTSYENGLLTLKISKSFWVE